MKDIAILVPESSVMQAIADPRYAFTAVNQFLQSKGQPPLFNVQLVGLSREVRLNEGLFSVHTDRLLAEVEKTDLIFIPALFGDMKSAIEQNREAIPWIVEQYKQGAEVASLCVGAFLLASTGLLDGKQCSTHWAYANEFREMFPKVELKEGSVITEEHHIYSSGGAHSYWNLLLYLVEKYASREMAILASKFFAVDIDRDSQSVFTMFQGQKSHIDNDIKKAQEYIEAHYQDKVTVEELADRFAIGRRSFERRFKKATHNTAVEYLQRVRMEAAKRCFENSRKSISEVMYDVGYSDNKAFRDVFKKITGLTPVEYRNRFSKMN